MKRVDPLCGPAQRPSRPKPSGSDPLGGRLAIAGASLVELIVATGVIGAVLAIGFPIISNWSAYSRLDAAASEIATVLRRSHHEARLRGHNVGLKFFTEDGGRTTFALFEDGDFDGVRSDDIRSGQDPQRTNRQPLQHLGQDIRFGIPLNHLGLAPRAPNSRRRLTRVDDPIRFNRSDIASFSSHGTATPGTVYLTDGKRVFAVRVRNQAGKVQVLRYDLQSEVWR